MAPNPHALVRRHSLVNAVVEEIRDGLVVERDAELRRVLSDRHEIFDVEDTGLGRDAETANFGTAGVAKILQLEPSQRRENQARRVGLEARMSSFSQI